MSQNCQVKNTHTSLVSELLKQGYAIKQGSYVFLYHEKSKIQLYTAKECHDTKPTSIQAVLVDKPLEVQREKYQGEKGWIMDITTKMVYIKLESGKTVRIPKTSLGIEAYTNTPSPRRSPREHTATKSPKTPIDVKKLTFVDEVDDNSLRCIEENTLDNADAGTPVTTSSEKEVTFTKSFMMGVVDALAMLWPFSK